MPLSQTSVISVGFSLRGRGSSFATSVVLVKETDLNVLLSSFLSSQFESAVAKVFFFFFSEPERPSFSLVLWSRPH